ncbi:MAG: hypothetical protein KF745_04930 [Phycisphaeraceae bacterium]|nr:hypothetical protein [Phycisphaeraceae bacterium]
MKTALCGIIAVAGLAASAVADANWTTQMRYSITAPGASAVLVPSGGSMPVGAAGVYSVTVQVGIFNLTGQEAGQSNQGLFNWAARGSSTGLMAGESLVVANATSRISPYNFGPSTAFGGAVVNGGTAIDGNAVTPGSKIQASRDVSGGASAVWPDGSPMPTAPTNGQLGADAYTNVFRYTITVTETVGSDIVMTFAGEAGPVLAWSPFNVTPPFDGDPGSVTFLGITNATPNVLRPFADSSFTIVRVPAPGAAALLGLGGLIAARRRRA